jgi:murein DD-endopeptidase MepM/ murein hydrolase activator NlpD
MHEGLDFTAPTGTLVVSTAQGTVTRSGWDPGYGNVIEVLHAARFSTRYAHLSKRIAQVGDVVERGGTLGEVGSSGRSTGPHLHYEVFNKDRVINPAQLLTSGSS